MAKESKDCILLRAPVGGGWWREPDADPAPPGFERIDPIPSATSGEPPGAPVRSKPISPAVESAGIALKSLSQRMMQHDPANHPAEPDRRTESISTPSQPPQTDAPSPATPTLPGHSPPLDWPEAG
jgi:hypothetical protein